MAILTFCHECNQYVSRKKQNCPKCGNSLKGSARHRIVLTGPNKKKITKVIQGSLAFAKDVEAKIRSEIAQKIFLGVEKAKFIDDCWEKYEIWAKNNKKSARHDIGRWKMHVQPFVVDKRMDELEAHEVQAIINRMEGYAPATIKQVLVLIKRFYNWSIEQELYKGANPAAKIKSPKVDNEITECLKYEEVERLLSVLDEWRNQRAALIIKFALFTGFRLSEILNLTWDRVQPGFIILRDVKGKSTTMPICSTAQNIIEKARVLNEEIPSEYIFPNYKGEKRVTIHKIWDRIRKKANIEDFRFHGTRHTFASKAASSGKVDIFVLQKLLNHKSIQMTQRYAHLMDETLQKSAAAADDFIIK